MRTLDVIFWVFMGGGFLWILGNWISMLIEHFGRPRSRRSAASSGGGFAETGFSGALMSHESASGDVSSEAGGDSDSGGDSGGGDFSGGGGESGGGGSSGGW